MPQNGSVNGDASRVTIIYDEKTIHLDAKLVVLLINGHHTSLVTLNQFIRLIQ